MAEIQPDASAPACYCIVNTTQAGTYQLSITQAGQLVGCNPAAGNCLNPITIQMLPAEPNLDNSYFLMPTDSSLPAGSSISVAIFSKDLLGNAASQGSIEMLVTPSGGEPNGCSIVQVICTLLPSLRPPTEPFCRPWPLFSQSQALSPAIPWMQTNPRK